MCKCICESIEYVLCNECLICYGCGTVKIVETVCYEIMCEIVCVYYVYDFDRFLVYVFSVVVEVLKGEELYLLVEVEIFVGKQVKV